MTHSHMFLENLEPVGFITVMVLVLVIPIALGFFLWYVMVD